MLFRRRNPAGFAEKLRGLVWPRKGFLRTFTYFRKRILRLSASPHAIALGVALGVAISWTPFLGFHIMMAIAASYVLRGSVIAATLGTGFGNPVTFPFIWGLSWEFGTAMLGGPGTAQGQPVDLLAMFQKLHFSELWTPVIEPMLVGSLPPALVSGVLVYLLTFYGARSFRARRSERLAIRAQSRLADAEQVATV